MRRWEAHGKPSGTIWALSLGTNWHDITEDRMAVGAVTCNAVGKPLNLGEPTQARWIRYPTRIYYGA
jgi:hypothetical protein